MNIPVLPPVAPAGAPAGEPTLSTAAPEAASAVARPARAATRGGALDLLRFVASLLIVIYHFGAEGPLRIERFGQVFSRGFLATDFFLMLSGYVLGRAYGASTLTGKISHGRFWLRRVGRVWPGHLIVLLMMAGLVLVLNSLGTDAHKPSRFAWDQLPVQALLVHAWGVNSDGWNLPSWSLSALIVCYALFPWLWRAANRVRHPLVLPLIGAAAFAVCELVARRLFHHALSDLPFRFGVVRALPLFTLGVCLARAVEMDWPSERAARALLVGGCVLLAAMQPLDRYALPDVLIFDIPSLVAIAAIVLGAGRLPVRHPKAWIEEGAKLSFALFITHILVGVIYWSAVHALIAAVPIGIGWQWLMWLASFPIALGAAWLFHTYVDQPLQDRLAPWLRGR